jgi:hypothetical protein
MLKLLFSAFVAATFLLLTPPINAQQGGYRLPDIRSMKHLTTRQSDHARNIPGKETTMDYYSAPNGSIVTIYSYLGKPVAFSTHSNGNYQGTYRLFMDLTGTGTFQEVNRAAPWELPAWTRR